MKRKFLCVVVGVFVAVAAVYGEAAKGDVFVSADPVGDAGLPVLNYNATVKDQDLVISEENV